MLRSSAEGALVEASKAPRGVECGRIFLLFDLKSQNVAFWCCI